MRTQLMALTVFTWIGFSLPQTSQARLGEHYTNVNSDHRELLRLSVPSANRNFSPPLMQKTSSGLTYFIIQNKYQQIRQYVNTDGNVFAITYRGLEPPNMSALLSPNDFKKYQSIMATSKKEKDTKLTSLRSPAQLSAADLEIIHSGITNKLSGVVYIPSKTPPGTDPAALP